MAATGDPSTYGPPSTRVFKVYQCKRIPDDESVLCVRIDEEIANSMLADTEMERRKTYKRPALARMSKQHSGGKRKGHQASEI
jgi:hypothetical protein